MEAEQAIVDIGEEWPLHEKGGSVLFAECERKNVLRFHTQATLFVPCAPESPPTNNN